MNQENGTVISLTALTYLLCRCVATKHDSLDFSWQMLRPVTPWPPRSQKAATATGWYAQSVFRDSR